MNKKVSLTIPRKIRKLLLRYRLGVIFLNDKKFNYIIDRWNMSRFTIAVALIESGIIVMNEEKLRYYDQKKVNYYFLHEISHAGLGYYDENNAHKCALRLAKYYDIEIDYTGIPIG